LAPAPRVIVAGGGAAGLEACLALARSARVTLIAPNARFVSRDRSLALADVAGHAGAAFVRDRVVAVDADRRRVRLAGGSGLGYDALLLATGAHGRLGGERGTVFVAPPGPIWRFELYERALAAGDAALVTTEARPLEILGARASRVAAAALLAAGVRVLTGAYARAGAADAVLTWPGGAQLEGAAVVAARLRGALPHGIPAGEAGFAATDPLGRVLGVDDVYAAGDCTALPLKHASLAAAQADAAAATIAGEPAPFVPVVRWALPGWIRWYVEAPVSGGRGDATRLTTRALWPPSVSFGSRHLTPLLARGARPRRMRRDDELAPVRQALRRLDSGRRADPPALRGGDRAPALPTELP
jgi:hypothetical protein